MRPDPYERTWFDRHGDSAAVIVMLAFMAVLMFFGWYTEVPREYVITDYAGKVYVVETYFDCGDGTIRLPGEDGRRIAFVEIVTREVER